MDQGCLGDSGLRWQHPPHQDPGEPNWPCGFAGYSHPKQIPRKVSRWPLGQGRNGGDFPCRNCCGGSCFQVPKEGCGTRGEFSWRFASLFIFFFVGDGLSLELYSVFGINAEGCGCHGPCHWGPLDEPKWIPWSWGCVLVLWGFLGSGSQNGLGWKRLVPVLSGPVPQGCSRALHPSGPGKCSWGQGVCVPVPWGWGLQGTPEGSLSLSLAVIAPSIPQHGTATAPPARVIPCRERAEGSQGCPGRRGMDTTPGHPCSPPGRDWGSLP